MLSLCITETLSSIDAYTNTTQLSVGSLDKINHCLQGVDARLAGVEDAVSQLCNMMVHFTSILEAKEKGHYGKPEVPSCRPESKRVQAVFNKQYYGSSSLTSFIGKICSSLQDFVADACMYDDSDRVGDGSLQECMAIMGGVANSLQMEQRLDNSTDGKALVLPPKELLDAAAEIYFDGINRMLPLFDRDTFHENVRRSYEPGQEAENAWILCFNGIILITLNTRALGSSNADPDRGNVRTDDSVKADFIKNFHANFKRGLNKPQSLLEPSLANVQALLLMVSCPLLMTLHGSILAPLLRLLLWQCSIAQENFQARLSSLFLHQACFVAKSIGLHKQNAMPTKQTKGEALERNYVFWALYVTDKMISTNLGISCCLPSFDCDVELPSNDPSNQFLKQLIARIELACIQEDTYQSLYSSQACRRNRGEREAEIQRLDSELALWTCKNKKLCTNWVASATAQTDNSRQPCWNGSVEVHPNVALNYLFHGTKALVHRAGTSASSHQQTRSIARSCLQIFASLSSSPSASSAVMTRTQILRSNHPLLPFFVLFANVIQDPGSADAEQDLHLMLLVTDVLQHVEAAAVDRAYVPQFLLVASSCCEAAGALIRRCDRRPPSNGMLSSPPDSGYGAATTGSGIIHAPSSTPTNGAMNGTDSSNHIWPLHSPGRSWPATASGTSTCMSPNLSDQEVTLSSYEAPHNWAPWRNNGFLSQGLGYSHGGGSSGGGQGGHEQSIDEYGRPVFGSKNFKSRNDYVMAE